MDTLADNIDHREYAWIWEICPWTDEQIQLASNLPLEIVRVIFEIAIFDKPWPLHLLLVCQLTRQWLEPLLYQQVDLAEEDSIKRFCRTVRERCTSPTKGLTLFLPRLWMTPAFHEGTNEATIILRCLPELRCLACWDRELRRKITNLLLDLTITWDGEDLLPPYKHLRRMTISTTPLVERGIGFGHKTFHYMTHLDIYFEPTVDWESLQSMQNLTHLSIDMVTGVLGRIGTTELLYWFRRILDACSLSVKIVIFGIVDDFNADFDLVDSEGEYFPPGWPPRDPSLDVEDWTDWLISDTRCYNGIDFDILHPIAQLSSGRVDPRAVAAVLAHNMPRIQLFRDLLVHFLSRDRWLYCDWTVPNHRDCWTIAEDIVEKRKGLTYAKLVSQML